MRVASCNGASGAGKFPVLQSYSVEWRLDKAQQHGAFLRKWPQMLVGWSRKPGSIPCKPRFPRAGWLSTGGEEGPRGTKAGYGHPEATLEPPSGHLVAN